MRLTAAAGSRGVAATAVTDASVDVVAGLGKLKFLSLERTAVTEEGVRRLRKALPSCKVTR